MRSARVAAGKGGPWQSITLQPGGGGGGGSLWRPLATTPGGGKVNISLSGHEDSPEGLARRSLSAAAGPELPCPWPATSRPPHAAHASPSPGYRLPHAPNPRACQGLLGFLQLSSSCVCGRCVSLASRPQHIASRILCSVFCLCCRSVTTPVRHTQTHQDLFNNKNLEVTSRS